MSKRALRTLTATAALAATLGATTPAKAADRPSRGPTSVTWTARQWLTDLLAALIGVPPGHGLSMLAAEHGLGIDPDGLAAKPGDEGHIIDPNGFAVVPGDDGHGIDPNGLDVVPGDEGHTIDPDG